MVDQVNLGLGGNSADLGMLLPVDDIGLGCLIVRRIQQNPLNDILNFLHLRGGSHAKLMGQGQDPQGHLLGIPFPEFS